GRGTTVAGDAQDLPFQAGEIAGVWIRRLPGSAAVAAPGIADADVEQSVGADAQAAAVVIAVVGAHAVEQHDTARRIDRVPGDGDAQDLVPPTRSRTFVAASDLTAGRLGVVEIEEAGAREVGIDRDAGQSHLGRSTARDLEDRGRRQSCRRRPGPDGSCLL